MTNTHINVGGHKITTNKVGQVHTITNLLNGFTGTVRWVVTNGICTISISGVGRTSVQSSAVKLLENVPKAKIPAYVDCNNYTQNARLYIEANTTDLIFTYTTSTSSVWTTLVYPVADDWVES